MPATQWKDLMNAADESAKEFELLPPDFYAFVIKDPAVVKSTQAGNPKYTINPSVESGPRENARVFHDFTVVDNAWVMKTRFFGDLATLGLGPTFFEGNPTDDEIAAALQGRRFTAEVFHREYNGKTYASLRNISEPTTAPPAVGFGAPSGLPAAAPVASAAPVAQAPTAPAAPAATPSPWATAPAPAAAPPAPATSNVPLPPAFGN